MTFTRTKRSEGKNAETSPGKTSTSRPANTVQTEARTPRFLQRMTADAGNGAGADIHEEEIDAPPPILQAKLKVNEPGDHFEQEADEVADTVMRMPASTSVPSITETEGDDLVQRTCQSCGSAVPGNAMRS